MVRRLPKRVIQKISQNDNHNRSSYPIWLFIYRYSLFGAYDSMHVFVRRFIADNGLAEKVVINIRQPLLSV